MTNKERYKQAFRVLHASGNISLENNVRKKKSIRPTRRFVTACVCAAMIAALGVTVYAHGEEIVSRIFGWGNNFEIRQETGAGGETNTVPILYTDALTEPVVVTDGRMVFIVNNESVDITGRISQTKPFIYDYTDGEGNTHCWLIGLNSEETENYGYAEYIRDSDGNWLGGYSARVSFEADGSTEALWLENGKSELNIPW